MTTVAFHIDQLYFSAPGGIGTYVRNLVPALAHQDPSLRLTLFRSRFEIDASTERWVRDFPVEEIPASIKTLYPRWDLTARPPLPETLRDCDIVHATYVKVSGRWRYLYRAGLRAAVRRADAIITPSRNTAEDLLSRTKVDPARLHVVPLAARFSCQ